MRVLIADDEAPARAKVRRFLARETDVEVVGEAATGRRAAEQVRALRPDVVFLDVQMPELDGFGVIDAVGLDAMPQVVFTTAFDEHALRAFEVRAVDYLLKPFTPARFAETLERVRRRLAAPPGAATEALRAALAPLLEMLGQPAGDAAPPPAARGERHLARVLVHDDRRAHLLPVDRIDWVEADRNYVRLHVGREVYTLRQTIAALEARLDPAAFLRVSRSAIVRLDAIAELHPWFHGDYRIVLQDGTGMMWSRRYRARAEGDFGVGKGE